jgi:hypothetical protein
MKQGTFQPVPTSKQMKENEQEYPGIRSKTNYIAIG